MNLPIVMPSNLFTLALELEADHPGRMGLLMGPSSFVKTRGLPFAIDNDRFSVWARGKEWKEANFITHLERCKQEGIPKWIVVPDQPADAAKTFEMWKEWSPRIMEYGWPLALAVQNDMTPEIVKNIRPQPEVIFVGGTTEWKWRTLGKWTANFPRVHVGRVNTSRLLWMAHRAGAESTDGTGWWHRRQLAQLKVYLKRSQEGLGEKGPGFFY